MKKQNFKKIISIVLALMMISSVFAMAIPVSAADSFASFRNSESAEFVALSYDVGAEPRVFEAPVGFCVNWSGDGANAGYLQVTINSFEITNAINQCLLDKHYFRKHGKNAYYGQECVVKKQIANNSENSVDVYK